MKFLSLSQPWLWAILDPIAKKHIENRSWQPPLEMIGKRFALHAAKSWDSDAIKMFIDFDLHGFPDNKRDAQHSLILGVATIDRIVTSSATLPPEQARWFFGPLGWVLTDVQKLIRPIPMKGGQGLRHLAQPHNDELLRQLNDMGAIGASGAR